MISISFAYSRIDLDNIQSTSINGNNGCDCSSMRECEIAFL